MFKPNIKVVGLFEQNRKQETLIEYSNWILSMQRIFWRKEGACSSSLGYRRQVWEGVKLLGRLYLMPQCEDVWSSLRLARGQFKCPCLRENRLPQTLSLKLCFLIELKNTFYSRESTLGSTVEAWKRAHFLCIDIKVDMRIF